MNRRQFLAGGSAASLLLAASPQQVIDTHTHFYDPGRPQGVPWPNKNEPLLYKTILPSRFLEVAGEFGIKGTVVVEASPWLEDNQWILDLAKDNPVIVGFVGNLTPGTPDFKNHLARFSKHRLFRGIRTGANRIVRPENPTLLTEDLRRMVDADWELDFTGNSSMFAPLLRAADQAPQLRIVIDHLPYDPPQDPSARPDAATAFRELGRRPQIYAKVSSVLRRVDGKVPESVDHYRAALDELWRTFGPDRLVYGSNWPVSDLIAPYPAVFKVVRDYFGEKGQEALDNYFWRNSLAAYKWVARG